MSISKLFSAMTVAWSCMLTMAGPLQGQECAAVYKDAVVSVDVDLSERAERNFVFNIYCEKSGETKSFFKEGSVGFPIKGIPLSISGKGEFNSDEMKEFCQSSVLSGSSESQDFGYQRYVVTSALQSFNQCVALENDGVLVKHEVAPPEYFMVFVKLKGVTNSGKLLFLQYQDDKVECEYNVPGVGAQQFPVNGREVVGDDGATFVRRALDVEIKMENIIVSCARKPFEFGGGKYYPRATFQMGTSWGPYTVILPEDTHFGFEIASQAEAAYSELSAGILGLRQSRADWKARSERFERKVRELQLLEVYQGDNNLSADYKYGCPPPGGSGPVIDRAFMASLCQGRGAGMQYRAHRVVESAPGGPCGHTQWALVCLPN